MHVVVLVTEPVSLFELACAVELFVLPRDEFDDWYSAEIVSLTSPDNPCLAETAFQCRKLEYLPKADLLVVPSYPVYKTEIEPALVREVSKHYQAGGNIISFCSGAFLLAALGILEGRTATTHWRYAEQFKQRFPDIQYQDDILYTYDGCIGCSAGSAAGIDLGIEVIRQDYGFDYANTVARRLVLPAHRSGGQSQYVARPIVKTKSSLSQTLDWAVKNLTPELDIAQLADHANMTRRTFDRQFKKHYNMTPLAWLSERKLELAKRLLETTRLSIDHIALQSGFDNAVTLRHNFRKHLATTPTEYRQMFCDR